MATLTSILLYCRRVDASADFYRALGFDVKKQTDGMYEAHLGTITLSLLDQASAHFKQDVHRDKGAGVFFMLRVEDVDAAYRDVVATGLKPSAEPHDWPWGNREFAIKDPDGYRIVFWQPARSII